MWLRQAGEWGVAEASRREEHSCAEAGTIGRGVAEAGKKKVQLR